MSLFPVYPLLLNERDANNPEVIQEFFAQMDVVHGLPPDAWLAVEAHEREDWLAALRSNLVRAFPMIE